MRHNTRKRVLVISDKDDVHIPYVDKHLKERMYILDPLSIMDKREFSYEFDDGKLSLRHSGIKLDDVGAVWYRKPRTVTTNMLTVAESFKPYAVSAIRRHMGMFLGAFNSALWISDYYAIERAENKAWQLEAASKLGFNVPETLITSDASRARAFITRQGTCIVKPQTSEIPVVDGQAQSFFATRISRDAMPDLSRLHLAPAFFQQSIEATYDVRVTVVGDKVFAARIVNDKLDAFSAIRDWRIGHYKGDMLFKAYEDFPAATAQQCVEHVKVMGLNYGAIDLVADKKGKLWFLENNPNGQWAFIEQATRQPIGQALAGLLETCNNK